MTGVTGERSKTMHDSIQPPIRTEEMGEPAFAEAVRQETGLSLERVCPSPFLIIKCPLCGGGEFTTIELASVWCDRCNARFQVYPTGDSGFGVLCTWRLYRPREARYLWPDARRLSLHMTVHWAADPRRPAYDVEVCGWVEACAPGALRLTDERHTVVRAGLHACTLGDVSSWHLEGHVPSAADLELDCVFDPLPVEGATWPACAAAPTGQPCPQPAVHPWAELPPLTGLRLDEWFLLHHWHMEAGAAWPVWYKVRPHWADERFGTLEKVEVVEKQPDLPGGEAGIP
jgi:hypothetical protein